MFSGNLHYLLTYYMHLWMKLKWTDGGSERNGIKTFIIRYKSNRKKIACRCRWKYDVALMLTSSSQLFLFSLSVSVSVTLTISRTLPAFLYYHFLVLSFYLFFSLFYSLSPALSVSDFLVLSRLLTFLRFLRTLSLPPPSLPSSSLPFLLSNLRLISSEINQ